MMATLYDVGTNTINYHIKKIFGDSELQEDSVIRKFRITAPDGKSYNTNHYSLEMIIAVGFKVNSERAVQFRKWVNQIAKDYTIKGWVMDDERLKRGTYLTEKYFDEQLERIREIRASERKFYQKITDLYATAIDYDKNAATTRRFYATVQNKMHYAVHGHTAVELIVERADHTKEQWGQTSEYKEFEEKTKNWTKDDEATVANDFMQLFVEFGQMKEMDPEDEQVQLQVRKLQDYITDHFYTCSDKILCGLGRMYAGGGELTENIDDVGGVGTAEFASKAINIFYMSGR